MKTGKVVKDFREKLGMKQVKLAELAKISGVHLSRFEQEATNIGLKHLLKILDVLGCSLIIKNFTGEVINISVLEHSDKEVNIFNKDLVKNEDLIKEGEHLVKEETVQELLDRDIAASMDQPIKEEDTPLLSVDTSMDKSTVIADIPMDESDAETK